MNKSTKAKEIDSRVRNIVLKRQHYRSISGAWLGDAPSFHHVIPRSSSGVGYEWNIVALTFEEHRAVHDHQPIKIGNKDRYTYDEFQTLMKNHLKLRYTNWDEERCKYHKRWIESDYEVYRTDWK